MTSKNNWKWKNYREIERLDAKMIAVRWFFSRKLQCERSLEGDIQGVYVPRMPLMRIARSCRSSVHLLVWFMVRSLRRFIVHSKGFSMATQGRSKLVGTDWYNESQRNSPCVVHLKFDEIRSLEARRSFRRLRTRELMARAWGVWNNL